MNTNFPSSASEVKPGQIRCFTTAGHECCGLVFRSWDEDWLVCPVKNLVGDDEEPTGTAVFAQPTLEWGLLGAGGLYALPELGGTVSAERVAASPLVWEVIPETVEQVWRLFRAPRRIGSDPTSSSVQLTTTVTRSLPNRRLKMKLFCKVTLRWPRSKFLNSTPTTAGARVAPVVSFETNHINPAQFARYEQEESPP